MPTALKTGLQIDEIALESPLDSNSSVSTKMLTKYGKILVAKGNADFAPRVKASYGLTLLISAKINMIINKIGIKYFDIY